MKALKICYVNAFHDNAAKWRVFLDKIMFYCFCYWVIFYSDWLGGAGNFNEKLHQKSGAFHSKNSTEFSPIREKALNKKVNFPAPPN
jgi:hypothetical protein